VLDPDRLLPYTLAVVALVLAPGPNQAMIVARSLGGGRRAGIMTSLGVNAGTFVHTLAAAAGLSAIVATSAVAFTIVKVIGALYLFYLGARLLTGKDHDAAIDVPQSRRIGQAAGGRAFLRAMVTGILNPKVAIFFVAFLPQFVDRGAGSVFLQFLLLGAVFTIIAVTIDSLVALAAGSIGSYLARNPTVARWRERVTGAAFIALGVRLAFEKR
jgi:threonine/homoserine/homoserine lactone efflux protein